MVRQPIVAGRFYAASPSACSAELRECIPERCSEDLRGLAACGALVPHAGWRCSGRVTGKALRSLSDQSSPETVVLIGAVHAVRRPQAAIYDEGAWETPLGSVEVDAESAAAVLESCVDVVRDTAAHGSEHSLEVQLPFIQVLFPSAKILPIMVPPSPTAAAIGSAVGGVLAGRRCVVVGTSDLTHYGPAYGLTPHGVGQEGLDWAKSENDRRMIDLILSLAADRIVAEARAHHNACGSGAIAATITLAQTLGARRAVLTDHTTSQETLRGVMPGPVADAVGYAGVVFGG